MSEHSAESDVSRCRETGDPIAMRCIFGEGRHVHLPAESGAPFRVDDGGTLRFKNGVACGAVIQEVDGYYVWYPNTGSGFWESAYLRKIADLLDAMNAEWDAVIKADPRVTSPGGSSA